MYILSSCRTPPLFAKSRFLESEPPRPHCWRAGIHVDVCHCRTPYAGDNNDNRDVKQWLLRGSRDKVVHDSQGGNKDTSARPANANAHSHSHTLTCILTYTTHVLVCSRRTHDGALRKVLLPMGSSPNRGVRDQSGGFWIRGSGRMRDSETDQLHRP